MNTRTELSSQPGLSIFLQTPPEADPGRSYAQALGAIESAERLGYETAWIAEAHFAPIGLPSALAFLSAAAQRTTRIRLGTAVVPLVFDHPIRLAETAAVADFLSGGRIEFGVGKSNGGGFSTSAFAAFRLDESDKDALYDTTLAALKEALHGVIDGGEKALHVYPPPGALLTRVWQATATGTNAAAIGRAGDGLLLHRLAFEGETGPVQAALVDRYLDALPAGAEPRIGVSRSVLPAASRADALALVRSDFAKNPVQYTGFGAASPEEYLQRSNVYYGTVDEIAERLGDDEAVARSTDYLFSIPLPNESAEFGDGLRAIAEELYPRLPLGAEATHRAGSSTLRAAV
ncbi:LLM class flavin-dependent oxidoreductase [Herbiconiux moechotypicola]|uniref:LLM class flavin-dependent oxidoreductase n=1 Tax=Herbiconiux moechotypicola TaxID=637393 RepID=UPI00217E81AE|nr:LLM class flavin-dependent oxidoreductase [Herbiconiux moechotypicola]MCS5730352.1 LLM class flavin-dependent oxidoreductase [Herbiconiux moechotypicola]